jgi:glyoxylase-like metal-dependent hydrolase (beta-lactamase superfamily II)
MTGDNDMTSTEQRGAASPQGTGSAAGQDGAGWLPVPESSLGPVIPERGYLVEEIRDGLYWVTEGMYQCAFLVTGQGVIAIDAPPSIGDRVTKAIRSVTDEPVTHVIYTHSHGDHIGTADQFPDSAVRIGHAETPFIMLEALRVDWNAEPFVVLPPPSLIKDES